METYVSFFGAIIPPGEKGTVICELDSDQEAELLGSSAGFLSKTLHVTQLALGHDAAEGDHTVYIVSEDRSFALGTLNKKTCPHMKLDIVLVDELVVMKHTGPSDVHVTGYEGFTYGDDDGDDDEDVYANLISSGEDEEEGDSEEEEEDSEDEDEDDESSDEDDDDEAPELVGLQHNIPSADDEDSIDEAEVSDSELLEMDLDSVDDDDDEQKEEEQGDDVDDDSSDDSDSSNDDDDSSGDSDSESAELPTSDSDDEEEREAMKKRLKNALSTPQPSKKQKTDAAPATAPGKLSAQAKTPTNEKEYTAALKSYLKEHGPSKLANLGSAVKRPTAVKKLKRYLAENTSVFSYDQSTDVVSLA